MRTILIFLCLCTAILNVYPENELEIVKKVANHILANHSNKLIVAEDGSCSIASYYQEWRYVNGVLNLSMLELYRVTGDRQYYDFVHDNFSFFFNENNQERMRKDYQSGIRNTGYYRFFSMSSLDDCGAMGAALVELNKYCGDALFGSYIESIADYILYREKRLSDGTFCRGKDDNLTVWLDDLYMSLSFLSHYGATNQSLACLDCAAQQAVRFDSLLADRSSGLYYHCYYHKTRQQGIAHWGRANGWALFAQAVLLNAIPEEHPLRGRLLQIFRRVVRNIVRFQDKDGMWHQLIDKDDSYPETSCTAMFIYSIAKGINEGWLEKEYAAVVHRAWEQVVSTYITEKGELKNVCMGTGIALDLPFYYARPTPLNDAHGLGAVIQAGIEIYNLNRKGMAL